MKIRNCHIKNFRGLEDVDFNFENNACLIAGPNAIGKSTVLEAIRLNRAILLSRYPSEGQAVLHSLGATTNPNQLMVRGGYFDFSSIARDVDSSIIIRLSVQLEDFELVRIKASLQTLAIDFLRGNMGNQLQQDPGALTQFLSSEDGQVKLHESEEHISAFVNKLNTTEQIILGLEISPNGQMRGENAAAQIVCGFLERSLPPQNGLFSFFLADRALPAGETAIQLGAGDADNQIKSHIAEPHLKYHRLKISIANSKILQSDIDHDFQIIFDEILPGKKLAGITIGPIGNFRVSILEKDSNKPFDIDSLSSGEKGLILTFLLIRRAVAEGGIVLIDEPELHLNPGVCRKLLNFLIDRCIKPNKLQAIICTHSAEILNSAYERDDCNIHHLKAPNNATPIYRGDFDEMFNALGRLGVSPAESFFYESRIFVEGPHDEDMLEEGFRSILGDRCQITYLGGRKAIESEVRSLQDAERNGRLDRLHCFIFDQDRNVSALESTDLVKVLQWDRYCFENYLLNVHVLHDVFSGYKNVVLPDRGKFQFEIKSLAIQQTIPLAAREAYEKTRIGRPGIENEDIRSSFEEISNILQEKLQELKDSANRLDLIEWKGNFLSDCEAINKKLTKAWETNWMSLCDGKDLLEKIFRKYSINRDRKEIKKELVQNIRDRKTLEWKMVEKLIKKALLKT